MLNERCDHDSSLASKQKPCHRVISVDQFAKVTLIMGTREFVFQKIFSEVTNLLVVYIPLSQLN